MKKNQQVTFEIDAAAGETVKGTLKFDGVEYEVIATPASTRERLRKGSIREDSGLGRPHDPTISLGPRGGACPLCGR